MNLKAILTVLAAAGVLLAAAWLPRWTAQRQDEQNENQVLFAAVEGVRLEFDRENTLTLSQSLAMLANPVKVTEIPPELASMSQDKVEQIARTMADRLYQQNHLLRDPEEYVVNYSMTLLYYGPENQNNIFWRLSLATQDAQQQMNLAIDDRTGTVCSLEYFSLDDKYEPHQMGLVLEDFVRYYLTGLGEEFLDVDVQQVLDSTQTPSDGSYLAAEMAWEEEGYGEIWIAFFVNDHGFYIHFLR